MLPAHPHSETWLEKSMCSGHSKTTDLALLGQAAAIHYQYFLGNIGEAGAYGCVMLVCNKSFCQRVAIAEGKIIYAFIRNRSRVQSTKRLHDAERGIYESGLSWHPSEMRTLPP